MPDVLPNITNFYNAVNQYGISKKYNFKLESIEGSPVDDLFKAIPYDVYAQAAKIPSRKISTVKIPYKSFEYVVPMEASYPEHEFWELTFITDANLTIRSIFETWNKTLYDNNTNSAGDITKDIPVRVARSYTLNGVYPTVINASEYDISGTGEVAKTRITFAFQDFTAI